MCIRDRLANVLVTVGLSLVTKPKPDSELKGLVYKMTELPAEGQFPLFKRPITWAAAVAVADVYKRQPFFAGIRLNPLTVSHTSRQGSSGREPKNRKCLPQSRVRSSKTKED